jgi:hypothetical protein
MLNETIEGENSSFVFSYITGRETALSTAGSTHPVPRNLNFSVFGTGSFPLGTLYMIAKTPTPPQPKPLCYHLGNPDGEQQSLFQ